MSEKSRTEFVGAHRIRVSEVMVQDRAERMFGRAPDHKSRKIAEDELKSVVLVELAVRAEDHLFDIADLRQGSGPNAQVAWCEQFLSEDGTARMPREFNHELPGQSFRVVFFLHYFDEKVPVHSSYGDVRVLKITPMPDRLTRLVPYELLD